MSRPLFGAARPPRTFDYGSTPDVRRGAEENPFEQMGPQKAGVESGRVTEFAAACGCLLLPCIIFAGANSACTFGGRESLYVVLGAVLLASIPAVFALATWRRPHQRRSLLAWNVLSFVCACLALAGALIVGSLNGAALKPYYDMIDMATYIDVDPSIVRASTLKDAGRILFLPGTHVNTSMALGFRSSTTYCVAPIAVNDPMSPLGSGYDLWAVGTDCCPSAASGDNVNFACGDVADRNAYAAVRLLDSSQRAFYRLAVQEVEAKFNIRASHPLFFHWVRDPFARVADMRDQALKRLLAQILAFWTAQFFVVVAGMVVLAKGKSAD